jgi:hypothetical protein
MPFLRSFVVAIVSLLLSLSVRRGKPGEVYLSRSGLRRRVITA